VRYSWNRSVLVNTSERLLAKLCDSRIALGQIFVHDSKKEIISCIIPRWERIPHKKTILSRGEMLTLGENREPFFLETVFDKFQISIVLLLGYFRVYFWVPIFSIMDDGTVLQIYSELYRTSQTLLVANLCRSVPWCMPIVMVFLSFLAISNIVYVWLKYLPNSTVRTQLLRFAARTFHICCFEKNLKFIRRETQFTSALSTRVSQFRNQNTRSSVILGLLDTEKNSRRKDGANFL
jgi:hypothetical protein